MKKNNSKKWIKTITITTAVLVFAAGAVFALKSAGTANTDKDSADTVVAAANEATDLVVKETVSEKETEVITETAATEATTEEATEAVTEQSSTIAEIQPQTEVATEAVQEPEVTEAVTELPVVQTPSDARVAQVIAGINAEREAAGVAAVTYDVTLTDMAQVRASENAANDYFVIENGKHKRPDGRKIDEIRPLSCEVGLLPRVHGSAIFTRGQTQVMSIVTLGMKSEEQMLDGIDEEEAKRYMHQYNFPPYSVGEARTSRGPGRREIGHGALAEKALVPVIPSEAEFPYAIRVVSEVLSSNGSTSQASICGSTLALMDAGVPIKKPVAGISTGLVTDKENPNNYIMLTDIQGIEDFFGDMDFKVGGTKDGITAIQVDIKIDGLTYDIIEEAFERTKIARDYILDNVMLPVISEPRADISKYAPRIMTETINPDKIKDVIGPSGKMINKIIDATGVKIDIEDDGRVFVYSTDTESGKKAMKMITDIAKDVEVGGIYDGVVTRIMSFGAFVDIGGGKEGLLHISKISSKRVDKVEDVLSVGDEITVKVVDIDNQDRINLSMKDLEVGNKIEASEEKQEK